MDYTIPQEISDYLEELDHFIEKQIKPLEAQNDNRKFFDHRREYARTDWENQGLPHPEWEELLKEARKLAQDAGHFSFGLPREFGGQDGSNLAMAIIREHLASKGIGLHNDLQNEHSIVGNIPQVLMFRDFGTEAQKQHFIPKMLQEKVLISFGLTEPEHGSDATWMKTSAIPQTHNGEQGWCINGEKMWITGANIATHVFVFARTSGENGKARGVTCFIMPRESEGYEIGEYLWTFNMPTDHPRITLTDVWLPHTSILGEEGKGLAVAQHFVHENRIRQAASSLGTARYCIQESVNYAKGRQVFGKPLSSNQGIQFPLVELQTEYEMIKSLVFQTAWHMDQMSKVEVALKLSDKVAMCNYRANRLACDAADRAIQVHGGIGYSRHKQFEHHYRHHRRYRITEGSEEIQIRKIAGHLFGFIRS
jgi:acyl-CoA dehydrogenase